MSKFDSPQTELLHRMSEAGWGNESSGSLETTTGAFCLVAISEQEKAECAGAMEDDLVELEIDMPVGNFIVRESGDGSVTVQEYPTRVAAEVAYKQLDAGWQ